jgi:3-deoxy-D-manno-octulosonate 8-phosphate phosphatase (KDO 8-P phosphatase)
MSGRAAQKAEDIQLLVLDVDGVLTDGSVLYGASDQAEIKSFNVKDGLGIKLLQKSGIEVAIITGRTSAAVARRAAELNIPTVLQGREDKGVALQALLDERALPAFRVAYMGDDLPDLSALKLAGLATCPSDAAAPVQAVADWIAPFAGGRGAVRALSDFLLTSQGLLPARLSEFH